MANVSGVSKNFTMALLNCSKMRVIKCGKEEHIVTCNCGCKIAYATKEIMTDTTGRFYGTDGNPLRFIICPQCNKAIYL